MANSSGPVWSEFYITDAGLRLRTEIIAESGSVEFTRAEVGEGKPASILDIGTMTGLVSYGEPAYVVSSFADTGNCHAMVIKIDNEQFAGEVLVTEVGVYAKKAGTGTEVLYGYAYALAGYAAMPASADGLRTWNLVFNTKISRSSDVTVTYDGAGIYLSFDEFAQAISSYYTKTEVDEALANKVNVDTSLSWYEVTLLNSYTSDDKGFMYCKDNSENVFLNGIFKRDTAPVQGEEICVLPMGFRPTRTLRFPIVASRGTSGSYATFGAITTDGVVRFNTMQVSDGYLSNWPMTIDTVFKASAQ